jgi:hypothetical protein
MRGRSFQLAAILMAMLILLVMFASACASSANSIVTGNMPASTTMAATTMAGAEAAANKSMADSAKGFAGSTTIPASGQPASLATKIIRNANLGIEAEDVVKAYQSLLDFAIQKGGYESTRKVTTSNNLTVLDAKIKIAPEHLDELLNFAGTTGKVINVQISSQDITESYYDSKIRLETMESLLKKYNDFLYKANTVNEALSVQSEINRLTTEIEALKGKLRYYDTMVAESTVTIIIRQLSDPIKIQKEIVWNALTINDMGYLMQRGLMGVVNALTGIAQWLAIIVIALSPLLVIGLIVLILVRRHRKLHPRVRKPKYGQYAPYNGPNMGQGNSGNMGQGNSGNMGQGNSGSIVPQNEPPVNPNNQIGPMTPNNSEPVVKRSDDQI